MRPHFRVCFFHGGLDYLGVPVVDDPTVPSTAATRRTATCSSDRWSGPIMWRRARSPRTAA